MSALFIHQTSSCIMFTFHTACILHGTRYQSGYHSPKARRWVPIEEEMSTLRFRMGMVEAENASLSGKTKTMEAIETVTRSQEKMARMEME
ncbi:hypothetical protein Tco_1257988 [Tanacetum coccineum]